MDDTILGVRNSQMLMDYLGNGAGEPEQLSREFREIADINDTPNQGDDGLPVADKIFLVRDEEEYLQESYYALVDGEEEESVRVMKNVWKVWHEANAGSTGFIPYFYTGEDRTLYVVCPVLDDSMETRGSMVFSISLDTVDGIMEQVGGYEDSFWALYTYNGNVIDTYPRGNIPEGDAWKSPPQTEPYIGQCGQTEYRIYSCSMHLGMHLSLGIPENHATRLLYDSIGIYIAGIVAVLLAGITSFSIFTFRITKPIEEVKDKLQEVAKGDFHAKLPDYGNLEFGEISRGFNRMTAEIDHLVNEVYEKQLLVRDMELKFLQTQMNPHFMFNVLKALALQARIDGNEELGKKIAVFSQLIQAKVYRSGTEKVQIKQEMEYVRYYLEIQQFRYGQNFTYSIEIGDGLEECYIPKLCIQLVAENAVVHGLETKTGAGKVEITVEQDIKGLLITVADNGVGFGIDGEVPLPLEMPALDQSHNHVGLNNAENIINLMYGPEYGIRIFSETGRGSRIEIHIPVDTGGEDR